MGGTLRHVIKVQFYDHVLQGRFVEDSGLRNIFDRIIIIIIIFYFYFFLNMLLLLLFYNLL